MLHRGGYMEESQEAKNLTQKIKEREEIEKANKKKVLKKIFIIVLIFVLISPERMLHIIFYPATLLMHPCPKAANRLLKSFQPTASAIPFQNTSGRRLWQTKLLSGSVWDKFIKTAELLLTSAKNVSASGNVRLWLRAKWNPLSLPKNSLPTALI